MQGNAILSTLSVTFVGALLAACTSDQEASPTAIKWPTRCTGRRSWVTSPP